MDRFNRHMLTLAREARGLTQGELAARVAIGQGTLSKYENGLLSPNEEAIDHLSRVLGFPISFFFQTGLPYGFPPFHYRRRKKLTAKVLGRIVAQMNIRRMHVERLSRSFDLQSGPMIPEIDLDEYQGRSRRSPTPEDVARSLRELWMLPSGPIDNMVDLIEGHGGIVIPCDFGTDLIDAMSQRIDGLPVLVFVNTRSPADRVRYTLAHELGHMCLHTTTIKDDEELEREADLFAGAFLLPADEIRSQLRRFDLRQLANLKLYWKVSMQAIAYRASELNLITPHQSKAFWIEMGRLGYRKREPNEPQAEYPRLLQRMVEFHQRKLGYSASEMASLLCLTESEFESWYGAAARDARDSHLRIVK